MRSHFCPQKLSLMSQPDGHCLDIASLSKSYNYKRMLYIRSSTQKTLQLRFDSCHQYAEASPRSASSNGASIGRRYSLLPSNLAAMTCKNALCCQKFFPLKSQHTPSSGTGRPPAGSAEPGWLFRQPCSSLPRYETLYVQYDTKSSFHSLCW